MMFQNSSYNNKWVYAFIDRVDYINDRACGIVFTIDVIQTWLFNFDLKECYVEREHSLTDEIGDNTLAENFDLSKAIVNDSPDYALQPSELGTCIVVASAPITPGDEDLPNFYGGVYSGVTLRKWTDIDALKIWLQTVNEIPGGSDKVISIFMAYTNYFVGAGEDRAGKNFIVERNENIDGYNPKNNKLFTYPYNYLYTINGAGQEKNYYWELFDSGNATFDLTSETSCNPQLMLMPTNYRYSAGLVQNVSECMTISGFPQCAYNIDTFKVWLAQNASSLGVGMLASGVGIATGNIPLTLTGVATASNEATSFVNNVFSPNMVKGMSGGQGLFGLGYLNFTFYKMSVNAQVARIVDDYWQMYGYPCRQVKKPNISLRPHWNYVKTKGCLLVGDAPASELNEIKKNF